jgi:anti-sigma regulatory factor (Ser/Thr protein kinase)
VPLSKRPLQLDATPRAASDARSWVGLICRELDREDLIECAELGVSELVANAILHAQQPISVRVRGTASHPRIEVLDGSSQAPVPPTVEVDSDDFLATFGRGLAIVAQCSVAWGASMEEDGKVVWFEPAPAIRDDDGAVGVFDSTVVEPEPHPLDGSIDVQLRGLDVGLYLGLDQQYSELRRELRLLALAHERDYPLAADLSAMFSGFDRQFPRETVGQVAQAHRDGQQVVDLTVRMAPEAASMFVTMIEMFDLADAFCRAERLLSIERTPEQRDFHNWYLGEFVRQLGGDEPQRWDHSGSDSPTSISSQNVS